MVFFFFFFFFLVSYKFVTQGPHIVESFIENDLFQK